MDATGCTYDREQVGLFVWAKIPDSVISSEAFSDKFLYGCNVFLTPGFIFGSNGERYIRISLCAKEKVLEEALRRIENVI
jgi:aspartate/methionine/tyrosine aminotransferase